MDQGCDLKVNSFGLAKLPVCILSCKTLVVLKIRRFLTDFSFIRLPSLKVLRFENVLFLNVRDFVLLLDGCPILEDLDACGIMLESEDCLTIQERKGLNLSKLTRAEMYFCHFYFPLTALHNVEFLLIEIDQIHRPNDEIPTFNNLTHLELHSLKWNWQLLVQVLNNCPKLQKLDLSEASMGGFRDDDLVQVQENWVDPGCVPQCLSSNLRTCTLFGFLGLQGELLMAKYILKNARVLQTMTIRGPSPVDYILAQVSVSHFNFEYIERELFSFPRASATCQLSVYKE